MRRLRLLCCSLLVVLLVPLTAVAARLQAAPHVHLRRAAHGFSATAEATRFVLKRSGRTARADVYLAAGTSAHRLSIGIYSSIGNRPKHLLARGSSDAVRAKAWNSVAVRSARLVRGRTYWLAVLGSGGRLRFRSSGCTGTRRVRLRSNELPARWPEAGTSSCRSLAPAAMRVMYSSGWKSSSKPTSTSSPTISGTSQVGSTLTAGTGTWTNNPSSFAYQWKQCNSSGGSCAKISNARSATYVPSTSDAGHTLVVAVTATNGSGSGTAVSAPTPVVTSGASTSSPPNATSSPTISGTTVEGDSLTASAGSWSGSPSGYAYQWQDCDSSGAGCVNIAGATAGTYALNSGDVGHAVAVQVTATNTAGSSSAASAPTPVVTSPQAPPSSTSAPSITGTPVVGNALNVTQGSWSGTPTSYAYAWQDCDSSGAGCTAITGATASSYTLAAADAGHTVRAVVTATNAAGSAAASSAATAAVTGSTSSVSTSKTNCFSVPGACGFPDPAAGNVGVSNCSALPTWSPSDLPSGAGSLSGANMVEITGANVTIQGYNIPSTYFFYVTGPNVTFNDDCLNFNGSNWSGGVSSATMVWGTGSATGLVVENSTLIAAGCTATANSICQSSGVDETLITAPGGGAVVKNDILAGAVEAINGLGNNSTVSGDYVNANGYISGSHQEDIYESQVQGLTVSGNVLLNPFDQTAEIFGDAQGNPCSNQFSITGNLMAGGGYILYSCSSASGPGTSSLTFTGNDIARCTGTAAFDSALGGDYCGSSAPSTSMGNAIGYGADGNGYWPKGGFFGLTSYTYCPTTSGVTWSGNYWDDNGASVSCG